MSNLSDCHYYVINFKTSISVSRRDNEVLELTEKRARDVKKLFSFVSHYSFF